MTSGALEKPLRLRKPRGPLISGIGHRLVIRVLMFSSAVTLVLTALQLYLDYSRDLNDITTRLDEIGHSNLESIGQALWSVDERQLTLQLQGILRLPHIRAAEVQETTRLQNPIHIAVGERGTTAVLTREFPVIYGLRGAEQPIGKLYVEATLTQVYRALFDKALIILASQGAKTFLVSFFIVYIFHRLVTRHLVDIASFVGHYRPNQPAHALTLKRRPPQESDELDEVVTAFNTMFAALQDSYQRLREANAQLAADNAALIEAEAALQASERQFRDYTETASDWLWETGPDHRFTSFSEQIGVFGVDRERLIGAYRWDYAADLQEDPDKWRAHRETLERHEAFRAFTYSFREKDGSLHYASVSGKPIFDDAGRFVGYRGTARDVTARSVALARVRELSTAVEQGPAGIAIVDAEGSLLYSNVMFLRITGLAQAVGAAAMPDVVPAETWRRLASAAEGGRTDPEEVFARRLPQGSFWGLISVAGIRSPAGSTGRLVVALQDITREKAEQQEREALLGRLQQTGKMEAIGRLAGGIAHDFNNLLGAMMGFAQFLVEDLEAGSESRRHAERIARMCDKGRDMVEQLLAFARARDPERQVLDLVVVLQRCRDLLDASLPSSSRLEITPGDEVLPVLGNKTQLQQVMLNLCLNAKDALGNVPGTISIRLARVRPDPALDGRPEYFSVGRIEGERDYALLSVSDTGAGMDAATKARIFEPFFTTKGLGRGTGLGLAVVHGIVAAHDGAVHVESAPGAGTTFDIYLPIKAGVPETETAAHSPCEPQAVRGHERVLVVDDDPDLLQALTLGLNRYGYEVLSLSDPLKALKLFSDLPDRWDLVISDQVMPGMAGIDLIAAMKQLQPGLRGILYTGFDEGLTEAAAAQLGVDVLLHKPLTPQTLALHIRKAMAGRS